MFLLLVAFSLAFISVAAFPCWPYSSGWGHAPSTIAGALLLCVAVLAIGSKTILKANEPTLEIASASPAHGTHNAFHYRLEGVIVEPEISFR